MGGHPENSFERNAGGKFSRADFDREGWLKHVIGEIESLERQEKIPGRPLNDEQKEILKSMRAEKAKLEGVEQKQTGDFEETT